MDINEIKNIENQSVYLNSLDIKNKISSVRSSDLSLFFFTSFSIFICFSSLYFLSKFILTLNIFNTPTINIILIGIFFVLTLIATLILTIFSKNLFYEIFGINIFEKYNEFKSTYNLKDLIILNNAFKKLNNEEIKFLDKYYSSLSTIHGKSHITYQLLSEWINTHNTNDIEKETNNLLFIVNNNLNNKDFENFFKSYETDNINAIQVLWKNDELRIFLQKKYIHIYDLLNKKLVLDKINNF